MEAADQFHARYGAISREYRYVVDNGEVASPLLARRVHHVPQPLQVDQMAAAASALLGRHDFAAFGAPMEHTAHISEGAPVTWRGGTERTVLVAACRRVRRFVLFYVCRRCILAPHGEDAGWHAFAGRQRIAAGTRGSRDPARRSVVRGRSGRPGARPVPGHRCAISSSGRGAPGPCEWLRSRACPPQR